LLLLVLTASAKALDSRRPRPASAPFPETLSTHISLYQFPFPFLFHSYLISDSRPSSNPRGKYIHSWLSILSRYVKSTLVCFRNNSPPHSTCITSIYSRHPSPADWFRQTPLHLFLSTYSAAIQPRCCMCIMSRRERLRLTSPSSFFSFPCSLLSNSHIRAHEISYCRFSSLSLTNPLLPL
jgi:hypothetical protein